MKKSEEKNTSAEVRQDFKERAKEVWNMQGTKGYILAFVGMLIITVVVMVINK